MDIFNLSLNGLTALPESLGNLTQLEIFNLSRNRLTALPESLGNLTQLQTLELGGNPLNPDLAAAYKEGTNAVLAYLRELAKGAGRRYESKLLILGDGNEGKTCVSRALRGLPFEAQVTTRGVDVEQWSFDHPDHPEDQKQRITLNIWDFEGQEINHQTHQFFLASEALYLLVFKCRDQFLLDRAQYWLDTIRARAPQARVAIVITECEKRTPLIPEDRIVAEHGDLLADGQWLFAVGCETKLGIPELQQALKRWAADLPFMGRDWPSSYGRAEAAIEAEADKGVSHIGRGRLEEILNGAGIERAQFDNVASAMATLGVITQFPDCPDLSDFIVLRPQWLTKAISAIMENKALADDKGKITLHRMQALWEEQGYERMFAKFHTCMKEFELCYDLDHALHSCLVPLRFGYIKPEIPWTLKDSVKKRRVHYKLNIRPPMGLMSRFIVKTHHMIVTTPDLPAGVYWHNGVFLRTGEGPLASEALCEFDPQERTLSVTVRAAFPQNMIEQIHGYVKAVISFFEGLNPERSYGCIKVDETTQEEKQCKGMHTERRIYSAILRKRILDCEFEFHDVDPQMLVSGISSFGETLTKEDLRREIDRVVEVLTPPMKRLEEFAERQSKLLIEVREKQETLAPELVQEWEQKLREYLGQFGDLLDDRDFTSAPGIISLDMVDHSGWNPETWFKKDYILTPYCECEGAIHSCEDGRVPFKRDRDWWIKTAPWIARGTKVLSVGLQLAFAGMPLAMPAEAVEAIKNEVAFMKELSKNIKLKAGERDKTADGLMGRLDDNCWVDLRGNDAEKHLLRESLRRFLEEVAPDNYRAKQWGSLRRVRMPDNTYRWLCKEHDPKSQSN